MESSRTFDDCARFHRFHPAETSGAGLPAVSVRHLQEIKKYMPTFLDDFVSKYRPTLMRFNTEKKR